MEALDELERHFEKWRAAATTFQNVAYGEEDVGEHESAVLTSACVVHYNNLASGLALNAPALIALARDGLRLREAEAERDAQAEALAEVGSLLQRIAKGDKRLSGNRAKPGPWAKTAMQALEALASSAAQSTGAGG